MGERVSGWMGERSIIVSVPTAELYLWSSLSSQPVSQPASRPKPGPSQAQARPQHIKRVWLRPILSLNSPSAKDGLWLRPILSLNSPSAKRARRRASGPLNGAAQRASADSCRSFRRFRLPQIYLRVFRVLWERRRFSLLRCHWVN